MTDIWWQMSGQQIFSCCSQPRSPVEAPPNVFYYCLRPEHTTSRYLNCVNRHQVQHLWLHIASIQSILRHPSLNACATPRGINQDKWNTLFFSPEEDNLSVIERANKKQTAEKGFSQVYSIHPTSLLQLNHLPPRLLIDPQQQIQSDIVICCWVGNLLCGIKYALHGLSRAKPQIPQNNIVQEKEAAFLFDWHTSPLLRTSSYMTSQINPLVLALIINVSSVVKPQIMVWSWSAWNTIPSQ